MNLDDLEGPEKEEGLKILACTNEILVVMDKHLQEHELNPTYVGIQTIGVVAKIMLSAHLYEDDGGELSKSLAKALKSTIDDAFMQAQQAYMMETLGVDKPN